MVSTLVDIDGATDIRICCQTRLCWRQRLLCRMYAAVWQARCSSDATHSLIDDSAQPPKFISYPLEREQYSNEAISWMNGTFGTFLHRICICATILRLSYMKTNAISTDSVIGKGINKQNSIYCMWRTLFDVYIYWMLQISFGVLLFCPFVYKWTVIWINAQISEMYIIFFIASAESSGQSEK